MAYFSLHPFPDPWMHTGKICSVLSSCHGVASSPSDHIPKMNRPKQSQSEIEKTFLSSAGIK